ncbi:MAG: hypothetical protein K5685_00090 [Bacteroidales bacterium]|nr:hypothetical protein [Bacteroidales bacterium]
MKKIVLGAAFVAAAGFGTFTATQNNNKAQLSDLELENIEILAQVEITVGHVCQYHENYWCIWPDGFTQPGWFMCLH